MPNETRRSRFCLTPSTRATSGLHGGSTRPRQVNQCGVSVAYGDEGVTVCLSGELNSASEQVVLVILAGVLQDRPAELCVNLSGLTSVDSCGIRALLHVRRLAGELDVAFRCVEPLAQTRRALEALHAVELLGISD
jgi:anti-anti-sigma factor